METSHEEIKGIPDADINNLRGTIAMLGQAVHEINRLKAEFAPVAPVAEGERVPNLLQRICKVYHDLGNVQPTGRHPSGFSFHKPDVLAAKLREMFAAYGIFFEAQIVNCETVTENRNGKTVEMCRLEITFSLVNADNPDDVRVYPWQATGESYDRRAFQVALGSAKKNFLLTQFLIGSDVDDEPRGVGNNNRLPQNDRGGWANQGRTSLKSPPPEPPDDAHRTEASKPAAPKSPELPESEERTQASKLKAALKEIGGKPVCPSMDELVKYAPDDWLRLSATYQDAIVAQAGDLYHGLQKPNKTDDEHRANLDSYPIEQVVIVGKNWFKRQPKA